ncbi:MAG: ABC transporter ATP-binding protein [Bacteroidota bacterium]
MLSLQIKYLNLYRGKHHILKGINLDFSSSLTFVLGHNGSGKSSLLSAIQGLLPYEGEISFQQQPLHRLGKQALAQKIAWVPQLVVPQHPIKVTDYVLLGRFPYLPWLGTFQRSDHEAAEKALHTLKIEHLSNRWIKTLSGGEWQRVVLARALAQETSLLLLDEPTQAMDPLHRAHFYALLKDLAQKGKMIICTTHHLEALREVNCHVVGLAKGEVVYEQIADVHPVETLLDEIFRRPMNN